MVFCTIYYLHMIISTGKILLPIVSSMYTLVSLIKILAVADFGLFVVDASSNDTWILLRCRIGSYKSNTVYHSICFLFDPLLDRYGKSDSLVVRDQSTRKNWASARFPKFRFWWRSDAYNIQLMPWHTHYELISNLRLRFDAPLFAA
jgi:hypothetical protein